MEHGFAGERWDARLWGALIVLCGALFLDTMDVSMVGVALPSIRRDLCLSTASLQWLVSGYVLGYGGLLLLGGRAADLLGRRQVFLTAVGVFAVASLLGGIVSDGALLVATRFIKGVSAAFTAPAALSIITTTFAEGRARNRALSVYSMCGACGFTLGLVLSGLLTEVGWRWTFLLPVPIALAVLVVGSSLIPGGARPDRDGRGFDVAGAVAGTGSMLLLVYGVVEAPVAGWNAPPTLAALTVAVALGAAFVVIERRSRHPLVRFGILKSSARLRANLGAVAFFGSYVGFQFVVTLYLQRLAGWTPLETALAFLPCAVIVAGTSMSIGAIVDRYGTTRLLLIGVVAQVAGYALFLRIGPVPDFVRMILPTMLLIGVSFAVCFPSLNIQATNGVADHEQGLASGLLQTCTQVGCAVALAVVSAVVTASGGDRATSVPALLGSYRPGLTVVTGIAALGLLVAISGPVARRWSPAASH